MAGSVGQVARQMPGREDSFLSGSPRPLPVPRTAAPAPPVRTRAASLYGARRFSSQGRYRLRNQKNSASRLVDGKRFFAHHGLSFEKARSFDAEDFGEGLIGFRLPEAKK